MVLHFKQEKVFAYFTKKVYNRPDYILGGTLIMLDIKFLRENPDIVKQNIKNKFQDHKLGLVDEVIELDASSRTVQQEADDLRANRNRISKQIGALMGQGKKEEAMALKEQVAKDAERLTELEAQEGELQEKIKKIKENVDVLTLTATPIPRTMHMSLIGIRDMSLLEEAPVDRPPEQR